MSLLSVDDWNQFLFNVGQDFYDLVHGTGDENTVINNPFFISYDGVYCVPLDSFGSRNYYVPVLCHCNIDKGFKTVIQSYQTCINSNVTSSYILDDYVNNESYILDNLDIHIDSLNSFIDSDIRTATSDKEIQRLNASNSWVGNTWLAHYSFQSLYANGDPYKSISQQQTIGQYLRFNESTPISLSRNINGYDYYFSGTGVYLTNASYGFVLPLKTPTRLSGSPVFISPNSSNQFSDITINIKNTFVSQGDTINTYNYTTNEGDTIIVNYSVDSDGVPTGYIDINPSADFSFDDLFDMFNTILAPLVGVGLDLPDWTDYQPEYPIVTGDINVNIDIPDVTGEYPAETITPIESDVYNIMSIDSMPQLPSLTGIDNGESAAVLGSSFTFLDGCGLLMPFVTIAIIRLLISKFRGDS